MNIQMLIKRLPDRLATAVLLAPLSAALILSSLAALHGLARMNGVADGGRFEQAITWDSRLLVMVFIFSCAVFAHAAARLVQFCFPVAIENVSE